MFHINPFNTVGNSFFITDINAIYEANVRRLELDFWSYRKPNSKGLQLNKNFWKSVDPSQLQLLKNHGIRVK